MDIIPLLRVILRLERAKSSTQPILRVRWTACLVNRWNATDVVLPEFLTLHEIPCQATVQLPYLSVACEIIKPIAAAPALLLIDIYHSPVTCRPPWSPWGEKALKGQSNEVTQFLWSSSQIPIPQTSWTCYPVHMYPAFSRQG